MARRPRKVVGMRGPVEHEMRDQILAAATDHFRHFGFDRATITDVAAAIGVSKAYVYKFFASKQAIGEVIATQVIDDIIGTADATVRPDAAASDKLRQFFRGITRRSLALLQDDRPSYEILMRSVEEGWPSHRLLDEGIRERLRQILTEGRGAGEFERKTPLDETCRAVASALQAYTHPIMLAQDRDHASEAEDEVLGMVLRSLADPYAGIAA